MKELSSILALTDSFSKLPGVGRKSAERMAFATLSMSEENRKLFAQAIDSVGTKVHRCPHCGLLTEEELCDVCSDKSRDHHLICVISEVKDVYAIEKMQGFNGVYHVLGGTINASKGIGPDDLAIDSLLARVKTEKVQEVLLALNPTIDGELTAHFIAKMLEPYHLNVTHLAYGLPMGASLDYADALTLGKAFEGRKKI